MVSDENSSGSKFRDQADQPGIDRPIHDSNRSEQVISGDISAAPNIVSLEQFSRELIREQKDLDPEIAAVVNANFMELFDCTTCAQGGDISQDCSQLDIGREEDEEPQKPETD